MKNPFAKVTNLQFLYDANFGTYLPCVSSASCAPKTAGAKPAGAKGTYVQKVSVSSTMGPGVKVDTTPYR